MMKNNSMLWAAIGVSLFFGLMCVALGTAFTPLMSIGGPLVCGSGEFGIDSQTYSYKPGQVGVTRGPYCLDQQTGEKKDVTFALIVVDTLIYGAVTFLLLAIAGRRLKSSDAGASPTASWLGTQTGESTSAQAKKKKVSASALEKLSELKEMRDANLISEQEYEQKKADILDKL